jgi:hypothetical protein
LVVGKQDVWVFVPVDAATLDACVEAQRAVDRLRFPVGKPPVAVAAEAERKLFEEAGFLEWAAHEEERSPRPKVHPDGRPLVPGEVLTEAVSSHASYGPAGRPQAWYRLGPHAFAVDEVDANFWFHTWDERWGWMQGGLRWAPDVEVEKEPESPCVVCGGGTEYEVTLDGVELVLCFECNRRYTRLRILLELEVGQLSMNAWAGRMRADMVVDEAALRGLWETLVAIVNARRVEGGTPVASALPAGD